MLNGALEADGREDCRGPVQGLRTCNVFLKNAEAAIVKGLAERTAGASVAGFGREYLRCWLPGRRPRRCRSSSRWPAGASPASANSPTKAR